MNILKNRVAAVATGALLIAGLSATGGAYASSLIGSEGIQNDSVRSIDLKDGYGVGAKDLKPGLLATVNTHAEDGATGATGPQGPEGPAGKDGKDGKDGVMGSLVEGRTFGADGSKTVEFIGGRFAERATLVASYALPEAGTYVITTDGFFFTKAATSGQTRMQLAIRGAQGQDFGTCFTGTISPLAGREATCSTTRAVTVDGPTNVEVKAFGYADDQGSADSGKVGVAVPTTVVKIG